MKGAVWSGAGLHLDVVPSRKWSPNGNRPASLDVGGIPESIPGATAAIPAKTRPVQAAKPGPPAIIYFFLSFKPERYATTSRICRLSKIPSIGGMTLMGALEWAI
jgi:hypothetical protein